MYMHQDGAATLNDYVNGEMSEGTDTQRACHLLLRMELMNLITMSLNHFRCQITPNYFVLYVDVARNSENQFNSGRKLVLGTLNRDP